MGDRDLKKQKLQNIQVYVDLTSEQKINNIFVQHDLLNYIRIVDDDDEPAGCKISTIQRGDQNALIFHELERFISKDQAFATNNRELNIYDTSNGYGLSCSYS